MVLRRWAMGEATIEELLADGELQRVATGAADGSHLLGSAEQRLVSARSLIRTDPQSAYVLGYDAARFALTALLQQQGLRTTSKGGHYAIQRAVEAQFGDTFEEFGYIRRRRNELEYPEVPDEHAAEPEAREAMKEVEGIVSGARALLDNLGPF